ncbi:alpha/beta hydrolase [Actinophytocola sp.]|uniref:alpha/beta fold hydrolase n=1 Tax=Actinophytocola sp. TaxID=1872138 RepID=UPI002D7E4B68|nr:alpha/beta hydrolase [Actinophytocola sp.]HET9142189.1 alpha/beta hydrolase [Actinophytocola sp.]
MTTFHAADGTRLAYRVQGAGAPVVCLPGGPMMSAAYLGDLGGLSRHRQLVLLDPRGTGESAVPADPGSYRCDRLVADVEALRERLGLDRLTLLAHCAGANLAVLYATRHPRRVDRLLLITPSTVAVGIAASVEQRRAVVAARAAEPWFAAAAEAFERVASGAPAAGDRSALAPFFYGAWTAASKAHAAAADRQRNDEAAAGFGSDGAFTPAATRAALAALAAPVLLLAGEVDLNTPPGVVAEFAGLVPNATLVIQPAASHHPWLDDPGAFVATAREFLDST